VVVGGVVLVSGLASREAQCVHLAGLPPLGVSPFVFLSPVVILHASHPSFEGEEGGGGGFVVWVLFGALGVCTDMKG
jgi:hypothetical protein